LLVAAAEPGAAQVFASLVSAGAAKGIEGPPTEPRSWVSDSEIGAALGVPEALAARLADASASLLIPIPLEYKKFHGRKTIEVVGDACSVGSRPALAPPSESATVREWLNWCLEWTQWMFEPDADLNISILEDKWLQTYSRIVMRRMAGWLARASRWTASLDFGSTEVGWALALEPETSATLGLVAVHPDFAALKAAAVSPSTLVSLMTPPAQGSYKPSAQGLQERFRGVSRLWAYLDAREAIGAGSEGLLAGLVTAADSKEDKPALDTQPHPKQLEYLSADFGWDHDDITCFAKDYALGTVRSAGVTPVELSQLATVGWATRVARSGELLLWLARALGAARGVRTSAQQLRALAIYEGEDLSSKAAAAARVVAQGRVESADWLSRAADVHRRLSGNLRDAMLAYVLERPSSVSLSGSVTPADLVAHLLTDPQVGTCRDTTRLLFCTAAAQTFVDRVERGLEGASLASLDTSERDQWRWMRRFRVWQANRRVFLYPENYLLPELRRTKSQGYEKFEQGIGAGRPDRTRVEALVSEYLNELHAMTGASIVSFTVSAPKSQFGAAVRPTLHIVGKPLDPAGRFVYREFVQCSRWTPWGDVDVDFGAFAPIPVLVGGSVLLVAPKLEAQPLQPSPEKDVTSDGYPKEQVTLKLVIARQQDGGWGKAAEVTCASPLQSDVSPADAGPPDLASAVQAALWYSARAVGNDSLEVVFYTTYHRAYTTPGYFRKAFVISPDLSVSAEPATVWEYDAEHTIDEWKIRPSLGLGTAVLAGDVCGALKANITPELGVTISDGSSNTVLSGTLMLVGDQATALALDQDTPIPVTGIAPWCRLPLVIQAMGTQFLVLPQTGWEDGDPWAPDGSAPLQPHTSSLIDSADKLMEQVAALEHDSSAPASAPSSPVSPATVQLGSGDPNAVAPGLKKGEDPLDLAVGWSSVVGNRPTLKWMSRPEASKSTGVLATAHVVGSPWASRYRFMWSAGGRAALYVPALQKCPDFPLFSADPGEQLPAYRLLRPAYGFDSTGGITHDVFPSVNQVGPQVDASSTLDIVPFRPDAPCAEYDWELFCHIPVATARRLADEGAFDQAVEWLQCVLDLRRRRAGDPGACWVAKVLREDAEACLAIAQGVASKGGIADALASARAQIDAYLTAPFTPHAIAAYRVSAHRWFVALQYVAVLLDWGDALFRQFTRESLAEALGLYEQAADVLGARPDVVVTSATENGAKSYGSLREDLDSLGDALLPEGMFEGLPVTSSGGSTGAADVATAWMASNYFCVPLNPALAAYWDRVGDRLFKLRHCLDIDGAERRLPLYAAPIDPLLLVKAAAAGVDIGAAIGATPALPATRFAATLGLASSLTSAGASLGAQLLTYLEKRDTEGLAQLRASRDENIEALRRGARQEQVRVAKQTRVELEAAHRAVLHRQAYYEQLKAEGRSAEEDRQHALTVKVSDAQREAKASILQAVLDAICPSVNVGFSNLTPFFTTSLGGNILAQISTIRSAAILGTAAFQGTDASIAGLEAGWQRREQEWGQQLEQATDELARIDAQLITADLQIAVAQAEDRVQEAAANLAAEVTDYLESRFTNAELYQWLSSRVSSLYYATYDLALHAARRAERCYAYETGDESAQFVQTNDWVAGRKGLLAAETLGLALRRMEAAFQEKNTRDLELTKTISLAKDFPAAFFDLITTGVAQVSLSEACFDEDHPGHYFRRVRSVSVSVPAVAGPYESVNLTLSLEAGSSRIRAKARLAGEVGDTYDDAGLSSRDIQALPRTLVTSTGREDTGVGPDAAGDGRYLPFEGAGVIGTWNLTMLQEANDFDLSTVTDVVLTIRYSARSSGLDADAQRKLAKLARTYVRKERAAALGLTGESCGLVLSLASDFGAAWTAFRSQATPASLLLPLGEMRLTERLPLDQPKVVGVGLAVAIFSRDSLETAGTWRVSYTTPGQEDKHLDFEAKPNDIQPPPDQAGQVGDKNGLPGPDRPWALYSSPMKSSDWAVPEMVRLDAPVELKTAVIEDVLLLLQFASGTSTVIKPADEED
jgi:CheY-like chemotaxis protein